MKIFRVLLPVFLVAGLIMTSCDKLNAPYATVKTQFDSTHKPIVLLEEYTGHKCINCPLATLKARKLADYYLGKVILMSVHGTSLADPDAKYTLDLRTPEANQWITDFAIPYVPMALIDRATFGGAYPVGADLWGAAVEAEMLKPVMTGLKVQASFNTDTKEITANVTAWFKRKLASSANICLYIVEDSIQGMQANKDTAAGPTPDIDPYYFNETFRASMNGPYGELLTSSVDTTKTYSYSKKFTVTNTSWDPTRISLIATITDPTVNLKGEIIGVNKVKISGASR